MKAIFADTAGWLCLADSNDPKHKDACTVRDEWLRQGGIFVCTDYVADETLTLMRIRLGLHTASKWWEQVERSSRVRWEWMSPLRAEKARRWFFQWKDKDFSFTDCTSFVLMRELRLHRALTTDKHFQNAGFETVP
jgi:predicted nucleic acid-binding protein